MVGPTNGVPDDPTPPAPPGGHVASAGAGERGRVLVVADDPPTRRVFTAILKRVGYDVDAVSSVAAALAALARPRCDAVVVEHAPGALDAFAFLDARRPDAEAVPVVVVTGEGDDAAAVRLLKRGVREYLVKSREVTEALPVAVRHVIHEEQLARRARAAEQRYRTLFEGSGDAIFIHDRDGRFLDVNESACRMLGYPREALLVRSFGEVTRPRDAGAERGADELDWMGDGLAQLDENGRLAFQARLVRADGGTVPVEVVSTVKTVSEQALVFSSARDISERLRHEAALARATAEWEQTFHAITDPLAVTDGEGRIVRANRAMLSRLGATILELHGRSALGLLCPLGGSLECPDQDLREPRSWESELPALGGHFQVTAFPRRDEDGALRNILFYCKDVTHERQLRARMLQTEKLSSLGQLVSGVAHELNNPLAAVQGLAELLLEDLEETGSGDADDVRNILEQSQRASGIVRNLLQFSRRSHQKGELFDLNAAVRAAATLLRYRLSSREIALVLELSESLPPLFGVIQHIEQVIVNLMLNAYEAIAEAGEGGRMRVETRLAADGFMELVVEDDGPGVAPENVNRLFEPFFTTKEVGRGTGLGLSVSYGLVQEHGGDIQLDAAYREGARFVVRLPVTSAEGRGTVPAVLDDPTHGGTCHVLVVEDEPELAQAMQEALTSRGVRAAAVTSAAEALRRLREQSVALVVCAADLRTAGGKMFHDALTEELPELRDRVALTVAGGEGGAAPATAFPVLKKPFSTERLYDWTIRNLRQIKDQDGAKHGII